MKTNKIRSLIFLLLFALGILINAVPSFAASVPQLINYQGVLTDRAGNRRNGPFNIRFSIWDDPLSENAAAHKVWPASDGDEHIGVVVRRGVFSVLIGGGSASGTLSAEAFAHDAAYTNDERYLQIEVEHEGSYEILWPRSRITSVGYAFSAGRIQGSTSTDNILPSSGNVGIGTASPSYKLEVIGNASIDGTTFVVDAVNNRVGIGTASPAEELDVAGDVQAVAYWYSSDARLKQNIQTLSNPIEKVVKLRGVSFEWKASGEKSIGLIAQEAEKVFPELVSTSENTGFKSVKLSNFVALLIEAVKAQQLQIDELKAEIKELKSNR